MKRNHTQSEYDGHAPPDGRRSSFTALEDDPNQGKTHIPKISRRIRACTECKRHKVRCDMIAGEPTCQRCRRMGLECIVHKNFQTLLEDDAGWKTTIELALADLLKHAQLPELSYYQMGKSAGPTSRENDTKTSKASMNASTTVSGIDRRVSSTCASSSEAIEFSPSSHALEGSQHPFDKEGDNEASSLVNAPMGSLYEVTQLGDLQKSAPRCQDAPDRSLVTDFISRGVVDLQEAEELFSFFDKVLNHYLWDGVVLVHENLTSVRKSSSMLSAAIITVTALHVPTKEHVFDLSYAEFAKLASESMLDHHHTLDDLRALCIGAFWLANVSWKLSGYAVRIATELNLHQCYRKAVQGSPDHKEQAKIWYLLYVLEHHFSIAYGRPPIIHEDATIINHNIFTSTPTVSQSDLRLHCQIDLFIILTRMYHSFGPDVDLEIPDHEFPKIESFNAAIDEWRTFWLTRLGESRFIGTYPRKAVFLHYNFTQLQLKAVALRAYHSSSSKRIMSPKRRKYANEAIEFAISTLKTVLDDSYMRNSLIGVPLYLHSMITFAAVFLLKIAVKGHASHVSSGKDAHNSIASADLSISTLQVRELVGQTVEMLMSCRERASRRHLSHHIARGLSKMLVGIDEWEKRCACNQPLREKTSQYASMAFQPGVIPESTRVDGQPTLNNHSATLEVAPSTAEGSDEAVFTQQSGLFEGSDPMVVDWWGFDEEYFPMGVFDFLQSQMPA